VGFGSDEQPHNVFSAMRNIMTLVLEESEKISTEMVEVILKNLLKRSKVGLPVIILSGLLITSPDSIRREVNQTIVAQIICIVVIM